MHEYRVTGVKDAQFNKTDRDKISINLSTDEGPVTLAIGMSDLENLIGCLHHVEHAVSLLDPAKGPLPGEAAQIRPAIVDHPHQIGHGVINGVPSVVVGLKYGTVLRWFALDKTKAEALSAALAAEIPRLSGPTLGAQ